MASDEIAAGLRRTPLLSIPEMRAALDADRSAHGIYAWWLVNADALPEVPTAPHPTEPVGLLYVGIGPGGVNSKRTLRARFRDHTRDTGRSTLRRVLASLLYEQEGWRPYWTDRPLLTERDNDALSAWLTTNLRVQWVQITEPWGVEAEVIRLMRPPLNRTHNQTHPFYTQVGDSRKRFREAAIAGTSFARSDLQR
jgi:GIY-YIG catalytic domain-containing protein